MINNNNNNKKTAEEFWRFVPEFDKPENRFSSYQANTWVMLYPELERLEASKISWHFRSSITSFLKKEYLVKQNCVFENSKVKR